VEISQSEAYIQIWSLKPSRELLTNIDTSDIIQDTGKGSPPSILQLLGE
jgi:hypothetical protein